MHDARWRSRVLGTGSAYHDVVGLFYIEVVGIEHVVEEVFEVGHGGGGAKGRCVDVGELLSEGSASGGLLEDAGAEAELPKLVGGCASRIGCAQEVRDGASAEVKAERSRSSRNRHAKQPCLETAHTKRAVSALARRGEFYLVGGVFGGAKEW